MHIHILGICGTFMGGIAVLAKQSGHRVTGCDANVYPPMSTQLEAQGIELIEGFSLEQTKINPDIYVIGNVVSRGNPLMEEILNLGLPYISGPQWLAENVLQSKWVLAVAGTHGKTTTSSMLAWILEYAGLAPGFLIGGVPENFAVSARLPQVPPAQTIKALSPSLVGGRGVGERGDASQTHAASHPSPLPLAGEGTKSVASSQIVAVDLQNSSPFFVMEADEYDTAFFDKRSKFVHYRPRTAILNNLEFDHADIFDDLAAIEKQFHHLVRTVPQNGLVVINGKEASLQRVIDKGCWSTVEKFGTDADWEAANVDSNGSFDVHFKGERQARVSWQMLGEHNRMNALASIAAARHVGVAPCIAIEALAEFKNVKRRMETKGVVNNITVYDDFAHHPTAIETTVAGLRAKVGKARILAVLEPRSNTMKLGVMKAALPASLKDADLVFCYGANLGWDAAEALKPIKNKAQTFESLENLVTAIAKSAKSGDHILVMSNGGFGGVHQKILDAIK
ncbi:MAG: UDP-N-acetylmuramate:L-alanyl-gamma-D-glutamyl-meso-diaminopimelate ligase [Bdellovibrio sp.]|nr:UDP-N-acetylmuramate:L-alanyl-gamma-D-glutamyl-meso-diaminopimelate ligase [Methylotenera sp.]